MPPTRTNSNANDYFIPLAIATVARAAIGAARIATTAGRIARTAGRVAKTAGRVAKTTARRVTKKSTKKNLQRIFDVFDVYGDDDYYDDEYEYETLPSLPQPLTGLETLPGLPQPLAASQKTDDSVAKTAGRVAKTSGRGA